MKLLFTRGLDGVQTTELDWRVELECPLTSHGPVTSHVTATISALLCHRQLSHRQTV